jgi:diacylglycerol kinase family enzyme
MPFAVPAIRPSVPRARRVATVLNANARAVSDELIRQILANADHPSDVFVSRSLEHAGFIARQIVRARYDVVLCGGGDGTFAQIVSDIVALRPRRMPAFGTLRLGTGNALASVLGATRADVRGVNADIRRAEDARSERDLNLLTVGDRIAPFAGVGLDSLILSDYNTVKRSVAKTPLSGLLEGGAGYATAIATRSLWRFTLGSLPFVTIRNEGAPAQRVDIQGRPIGAPVPRGEILFSGPAAVASASTIPNYGLGMRVFPQVDKYPDRFQLRVGKLGAFSTLLKLRELFNGTYDPPGINDFICTSVSMEVAEPTPFQVGGDEVGKLRTMHIGMTSVRAIRGTELPLVDARSLDAARKAAA